MVALYLSFSRVMGLLALSSLSTAVTLVASPPTQVYSYLTSPACRAFHTIWAAVSRVRAAETSRPSRPLYRPFWVARTLTFMSQALPV